MTGSAGQDAEGPGRPSDRLRRLVATGLEGWARRVRGLAVPVVVGATVATVALGWYAAAGLGIDTETQDMFSADLEWRRTNEAYRDAFPHVGHTLQVVIDGEAPEIAESVQEELAAALEGETGIFESVHAPGGEEFFRRNGLLFLPVEELEGLARRVSEYGPALRRLEAAPTLATFAAVLDSALADGRYGDGPDLAPFLGAVGRSFEAGADRQPYRLPWSRLLQGDGAEGGNARRFVVAKPALDYSRARPGKEAMEAVRSLVAERGWDADPLVRVRLTGRVAMQDEEIRSVSRGAGLAGVLALFLVAGVLYFGLGSGRLILASMATLVAGLAATAAFAAAAVGRLNLISVAFAVLYIGLGIDYAVHLGLRYREVRDRGGPQGEALSRALGDVGPSLALSAVTTALAFYAFVPTDFVGISELGVIAGTGMVVSLVATVVLMPALLEVLPVARGGSPASRRGSDEGRGDGGGATALDRLLTERRRWVVYGGAVLGLASLALLPRARFDSNPLLLRDPATESVSTYQELLEDERASPLTIALLRPSSGAALSAAGRARELEAVASARTVADLVPGDQEEKVAILVGIARSLGPPPGSASGDRTAVDRAGPGAGGSSDEGLRAVDRIRRSVLDFLPWAGEEERRMANYALYQIGRWKRVAGEWPEGERGGFLRELEAALLGTLPGRIERLRGSLSARPFGLADLPADLRRRWVSPGGIHRVEVVPAENLARPAALERFVTDVRREFPDATGPPVMRHQAGVVAVEAFREALLLASAAALAVLLLSLRSVRDTARVLLPVLLAGLVTVAGSVLLDVPFNFANIIALPLLLGVGLDNGIHMVHRSRTAPPEGGHLLRTSTGRAVVVSFLTTIFTFGNLAFSPHRGMASMGRLLTVGMAAALAATALLLPALIGPGPARGGDSDQGESAVSGAVGGPG